MIICRLKFTNLGLHACANNKRKFTNLGQHVWTVRNQLFQLCRLSMRYSMTPHLEEECGFSFPCMYFFLSMKRNGERGDFLEGPRMFKKKKKNRGGHHVIDRYLRFSKTATGWHSTISVGIFRFGNFGYLDNWLPLAS